MERFILRQAWKRAGSVVGGCMPRSAGPTPLLRVFRSVHTRPGENKGNDIPSPGGISLSLSVSPSGSHPCGGLAFYTHTDTFSLVVSTRLLSARKEPLPIYSHPEPPTQNKVLSDFDVTHFTPPPLYHSKITCFRKAFYFHHYNC